MSVFNTDDPSGGKPSVEDFVLKLKEAKGENWADPQTIAKGYLSSQQHIDTLEDELRQLREEKQKNEWTKDVLDKLGERQPTSTAQSQVPASTSDEATPAKTSEDELKSLIEQTLTKQEQERTASENRKSVEEGLRTLYGTEAEAELKTKANELGMSVARLQALAEESPNAFFTLIGQPQKKETNAVPGTQVNTSAGFNSSSKKNWAYYQRLKKENPKLYRGIPVQNEMLAERQRQGDAFYS